MGLGGKCGRAPGSVIAEWLRIRALARRIGDGLEVIDELAISHVTDAAEVGICTVERHVESNRAAGARRRSTRPRQLQFNGVARTCADLNEL